ncbi:MAG: NAD(+) synthetase [Chloroflexi bacterium GWB2_49_20]|nr:MAG: NAD(+) synthetase [Chloroflexi bacterium GWB2_49_20]OGN76746.1 MAG: NAD(+) synthetase [Chloroflexi bacterium GWC2_49_37]OGN83706.1 MAG: NAD(+) synthetase [Chloroflexi bacterium GWD2_49_16]HBG74171.1 NAD(+) synthetase [Anaerolineae bacterium]HCC79011.1 NAD(+) synthetase [Anaerolineae bacterium]
MIDLPINSELVRNILVRFIDSEITRAGYSRAIINLSGGIDSAVACVLAAEALGPENVLAIRIPYKTSAPDSLEHAQLLIDQLNIQSLTIPITEMVDSLIECFPDMSKTRKGNIMARARMIIAYDQSEAFHGLVIGTGNKTEILLGYTTLFGDSACAINPIGDLYKTQVRQLAVDLKIPQVIIDKPPSADLWLGQTDEAELGFTYEKVDQLLYLLIDHRYQPAECIQAGFEEKFVQSVIDRIQRFQFKRSLPPIAKISSRTIGSDFLFFRDSGT